MDNEKELDYRNILKGKTLRVYFFLLSRNKGASLREVQRKTGLSSPSLAQYHLDKLREVGLVELDYDSGYRTAKSVKVGVLHFFTSIGWFLLPRYTFYALFSTSLLLSTLILFDWIFTPTFILLILVLVFTSCVFWTEALQVWKSRPTR